MGPTPAACRGPSGGWRRFHRPARGLPFGVAVDQPAHLEPSASQRRDRVEGKNAIRAAAIGNDFPAARQSTKALLKLAQGNIDRTRQVPDGDLDIYRSAKTLMDTFGTVEAEIHAAQRADELLAAGDMDGRRIWLKILEAIKELADETPPDGTIMH